MARFDWVRRMGVHEAYHRSGTNRLIHWLCIPIELGMIVKLLSLIDVGVDFALLGLIGVGAIYLATDVVAGALMVALLAGLRFAALRLSTGWWLADAGIAAAVFVASFVFQTRVGHGVFERGVDDTEKNLAEFRRTKNPIPLVLIFYYHLVEILFAIGYRPSLRAEMEQHRAEESAKLG